MRLGWVTSNASFVEKYIRIGETTTQGLYTSLSCSQTYLWLIRFLHPAANGLAQATISNFLSPTHGWGVTGFLRWIFAVRLDYQEKRDFYLDNLAKYVSPNWCSTVSAKGGVSNMHLLITASSSSWSSLLLFLLCVPVSSDVCKSNQWTISFAPSSWNWFFSSPNSNGFRSTSRSTLDSRDCLLKKRHSMVQLPIRWI